MASASSSPNACPSLNYAHKPMAQRTLYLRCLHLLEDKYSHGPVHFLTLPQRLRPREVQLRMIARPIPITSRSRNTHVLVRDLGCPNCPITIYATGIFAETPSPCITLIFSGARP